MQMSGIFGNAMDATAQDEITPGSTITGAALPEPVEVHAVAPLGGSTRIMGVGRRTGNPFNAVLTADQLAILQTRTLYGKEKKSLAYVIGIMNLILHGIEAPNLIHGSVKTMQQEHSTTGGFRRQVELTF